LLLISAIAIGFFFLNLKDYAIDDAWITYRYAENLAEGQGFVYNLGERVLGTSTPLYTFLLSFVHLFGGYIPVASQVIGLISTLIVVVTIYYLARTLDSPAAGFLASTFLVFAPEFHTVSAYGMETPLYMACIALAFYCYAREELYRATIFCALCFLIRFDGIAVGFAMIVVFVFHERRIPWKQFLLFLILTLPWLLFSKFYFGSIFPNSFLAKRLHDASHVRAWMIDWIFNESLLILAVFGAIIGLTRKRKAETALLFWMLSYATAFAFSDLYGHKWYRSPLCIPLVIFAAIGLRRVVPVLPISSGAQKIAAAVLVTVLLIPDLSSTWIKLSNGTYGVIQVEETRYRAVQWIKDNVEKDAVIASSGIGHLGYLTGNYILDTAGLVSPQVVQKGGARDFFEFGITTFKPAYIFQAMTGIPTFMKNDYAMVNRWKTGDKLFPQFVLLKRRDAVP
jgi:4-amino-4-deoxy-L-arabinose transferase-like glycosyltransferase